MASQRRKSDSGRKPNNRTRSRLRRLLRCETLESRQLMASDFAIPLHNTINPEDVNDDGRVSPIDALGVINAVGRERRGSTADSNMRTDVNNDGKTTSLDALLVINRMKRTQQAQPTTAPTTVSTEVRSIDGTGNNLTNTEWGSTDQPLLRVADAGYGDGVSTPAGENRPSAREISNVLSDQEIATATNDRNLSAFLYVWGQFLDHDLSLTETGESKESFAIAVPTGDPEFDPNATGTKVIPMSRANYESTTGTDESNPRQQTSILTAWIDGSQIYGSDPLTADSLREFQGGRMLISEEGLLPTDSNGQFLAGDIRVNENPELSAIQTLFVREHNFWADRIAMGNSQLSDEDIYQQARAIVIAELQSITYNEFLPSLLGKNAIARYQGYDDTVNPTIANEFSTAAFRFGHSTLNDDIEFIGNDGRAVQDGVTLAEAFFNTSILKSSGIDSVLKYVSSTVAEEIDLQIVDSLRNMLFGQPGQGGLDLAALNIQRGRDHGLADYNSVRAAYGLPKVESFAEITSDAELQQKLESLYGNVDNIDLWVGILAEDHSRGSSMGETGSTIIADQFQRLRDGDRFWYENIFRGRQLQQIQQTRLSDIIQRNTDITNLQSDVFSMRAEVTGSVVLRSQLAPAPVTRGAPPARPNSPDVALSGVTVELLNEDGEVIASTKTDSRGQYRFTEFDETGDYSVQIVLSPNLNAKVTKLDFLVSNGATRLRDLNFVATKV